MSLNIHRSEQVIHYDGQEPITYWGFYLTGTSFSDACYPFTSREDRERWGAVLMPKIRAAFPAESFTDYDCELISGMAAFIHYGDEHQTENVADTMQDAYPILFGEPGDWELYAVLAEAADHITGRGDQ